MKQIPILFSTPMVQAILEGRKTETRRIIKLDPYYAKNEKEITIEPRDVPEGFQLFVNNPKMGVEHWDYYENIKCPYGYPGDLLWVREAFNISGFGDNDQYYFKASPETLTTEHKRMISNGIITFDDLKWKPSIHMPKVAARIWLTVKEIKVERLQDISEEDAKAEGSMDMNMGIHGITQYRSGFEDIWERVNGQESWNANPWVWVVKFEINKTK